ncbi:MAG TPA: GTPase HflX, partial [Polyangiaceae bacterium]|nr:GTPase HflX [Polyangiaceae bacterium]
FRSTLDEALDASLLLCVADASDPTCDEQLEVTRTVLKEIGADTVPSLLVLNKVDLLDAAGVAAVSERHPGAVLISARDPQHVANLRQRVIDHFESRMQDAEFFIPYTKQALRKEVYGQARVLAETYDETGVTLRVRAMPAEVARLRQIFG